MYSSYTRGQLKKHHAKRSPDSTLFFWHTLDWGLPIALIKIDSFSTYRIEVELIPAGYTACLQVINKGPHRTLKHFYWQDSLSWLTPRTIYKTSLGQKVLGMCSCIDTWNSIQLKPYEPELKVIVVAFNYIKLVNTLLLV